ncbi:MAG TPA: hypothetical protein VN521_07970, partial [Negativicutes bacterium]|nr:hypothetical protein [Negativicutes bacterium]
ISFDWTGPCGWFFWPRNHRGVYLLKEQSSAQSEGDRFYLYYYPHPDEDVFADFSLAEQVARVSEVFSSQGVQFYEDCCEHGHGGCRGGPFQDLRAGKGIPVPAARERLAASLYWVGALTFGWRGGRLRSLTVEAPCRSRTWAIVDIPGPRGDGPALRAGDIDRNVPCWQLAWSFVTALAADLGTTVRFARLEGVGGRDAHRRGVVGLRAY